jgi:hypothetical protein
MKAIDRQHYLAIKKVLTQIETDMATGEPKKLYLFELDERHEVAPHATTTLGTYYDV